MYVADSAMSRVVRPTVALSRPTVAPRGWASHDDDGAILFSVILSEAKDLRPRADDEIRRRFRASE